MTTPIVNPNGSVNAEALVPAAVGVATATQSTPHPAVVVNPTVTPVAPSTPSTTNVTVNVPTPAAPAAPEPAHGAKPQ